MCLIDEVTRFEPAGGPKGIGYLEAAAHVPVDAWFFDGHFHNDPCMPGTLMVDAAVQCLAFLMAAMGMTVKHDGWRFEPVTEEAFKFVCRGQVIPDRAQSSATRCSSTRSSTVRSPPSTPRSCAPSTGSRSSTARASA